MDHEDNSKGSEILKCPRLDEYGFTLAKIVAKTSKVPHPDVVAQLKDGIPMPARRARNGEMRGESFIDEDTSIQGVIDDNFAPAMTLLWAHGLTMEDIDCRRGWHFAHVWNRSKDVKSFAHPANIALVPEAFASLTDKDGPLTRYLRFHAQEKYKWNPTDNELARPVGYEDIEWSYLPSFEGSKDNILKMLAKSGDRRAAVWRKLLEDSARKS